LLPTFLLGFFKRAALGYDPLGWSLSHTFLYFLREMWFENPQDRQPTPDKRTGTNAWARRLTMRHTSSAAHHCPMRPDNIQNEVRTHVCNGLLCRCPHTHRAPLWRGTPRGGGQKKAPLSRTLQRHEVDVRAYITKSPD